MNTVADLLLHFFFITKYKCLFIGDVVLGYTTNYGPTLISYIVWSVYLCNQPKISESLLIYGVVKNVNPRTYEKVNPQPQAGNSNHAPLVSRRFIFPTQTPQLRTQNTEERRYSRLHKDATKIKSLASIILEQQSCGGDSLFSCCDPLPKTPDSSPPPASLLLLPRLSALPPLSFIATSTPWLVIPNFSHFLSNIEDIFPNLAWIYIFCGYPWIMMIIDIRLLWSRNCRFNEESRGCNADCDWSRA